MEYPLTEKFDSINVNENGNQKFMKNGNEMEKFETETDKFGYVFLFRFVFRFHFRCISISRHVT